MTTLVRFIDLAHEAAGAAGTLLSLRPLLSRDERSGTARAKIAPREREVISRLPSPATLAGRIGGGLLFSGLEGGLGCSQSFGFPAFRGTGFPFGNRTLTMIGVC